MNLCNAQLIYKLKLDPRGCSQIPRVLADVGGTGTLFALPQIENLLDRPIAFTAKVDGPGQFSFHVEGFQGRAPNSEGDNVMLLGALEQGLVMVRYTPGTLDEVCSRANAACR